MSSAVGGGEGGTFDLKASHLPEEDGAEQEDGIEKQQTQTQPAIQLPVVQMNAHHLWRGSQT